MSVPLLLVAAVASAYLAWGALRNLWSDYQDSPAVTYVIIGVLFVGLSLGCSIAAVRLLRRPG